MGLKDCTDGRDFRTLLPKRACLEESKGADMGVGGGGGDVRCPPGRPAWINGEDVLFYVGQNRKAYSVSADSLIRSSAYFRNILAQRRGAPLLPVVIDCEEIIFDALLLLMRYGAWEALPPMSPAQAFRLKKEAELYGIHHLEPPKTPPPATQSPTSPGGSPNSTEPATPSRHPTPSGPPSRLTSARLCDGVRLSGCTTRQLHELPDFPLDLADPTKLLLVACVDGDRAPIYACEHCSSRFAGSRPSATQWALSFHYRHAFCTGCGRPPTTKLSPKLFAEMFMGATAQYNSHSSAGLELPQLQGGAAKLQAAAGHWWVGSDSTCLLRLVSSPGGGPDACCSTSCAASRHPDTVWAATFFYSYAFCTRCGQPAHSSALLSLLLTLRYGGASIKGSSKSGRSFKLPSSPT